MARTVSSRAFFPVLLALYLLAAAPAWAESLPVPSPPNIAAKSYILQDFQSGRILAQKNPDEHIPPASLTKMMTAYIVFHELKKGHIHMDDKVTISKNAWHTGGSRMFVKVGSHVTVHKLLQGMIVDSGNDATVALAEYVGGTEKTFAQYMNHFAAKLGMKNTHFANPTGLPQPKHYSTARDLAILARALVRDFPGYLKLFREKKLTWNGIKQYNRNELLWRDPSVDGLKTGHTKAAGYCLVTTAERHGMRLVSVVTHTDSGDARARTSEALLNYGYRFFKTRKVSEAGAAVKKLKVWKGATNQVPVGMQKAFYVTLPENSSQDLKTELNTHERVIAPVSNGQALGVLKVKDGGKVISQTPVYALQAVKAGGWFKQLWDSIILFFKNLL